MNQVPDIIKILWLNMLAYLCFSCQLVLISSRIQVASIVRVDSLIMSFLPLQLVEVEVDEGTCTRRRF